MYRIEVISIHIAHLPAKDALFMPDNHKDRCLTIRAVSHCINPEQKWSFIVFQQFLPESSSFHLFFCVEIIKLKFSFPGQLKKTHSFRFNFQISCNGIKQQ